MPIALPVLAPGPGAHVPASGADARDSAAPPPLPTDRDRSAEQDVRGWLATRPGVVVGYSGGVDSAYLAAVALDVLGPDRVLAVVGQSASYPAEQWETARAIAAALGLPLRVVATHELDDPRYAANPTDRCYFCKRVLWDALAPIADARGFALLDGTNADDLLDHRPGARAATERGVHSPLATVGLTKAAIRRLSAARGLSGWDRPSAPCLASRIPYRTPVTADRLARIERAESALRGLGVAGDLRVRLHDDLARIELAAHELTPWLLGPNERALRAAVVGAGFRRVAIDLRGFRSGSLNVLGGVVTPRDASPLAGGTPTPPVGGARSTRAHPTADAAAARAQALEAALADAGHPAAVEVLGALAVLRMHPGAPAPRATAERAVVVQLAARAGFTHVAVESTPDAGELLLPAVPAAARDGTRAP